MVDIVHINRFISRKDNKVKPYTVAWSDFVDFILSEPVVSLEKETVPLFNCAEYIKPNEFSLNDTNLIQDKYTFDLYTRRRSVNIVNIDLLILDYDGGMGLDEAKDRFSKYEYVGYTSYNHRITNGVDKFRLIFNLTKPISAIINEDDFNNTYSYGIWDELKQSILEFAGDCDPASVNQNQIYYIPSVHPDNQDNYESWHNESGCKLDWEAFNRTSIENKSLCSTSEGKTTRIYKTSEKHLHPNDVLNTEIGQIRVGDVRSKIEGVVCPFHDDKNGTEFVKYVPETGNTFLYCRRCDSTYFMRRDIDQNIDLPAKDIPLLEFPHDKEFSDSSNREQATRQLEEIERQILSDKFSKPPNSNTKYTSHIIYSPEGSGKSHLVVSLARKGEKIIFACKSWKQAEKKYEEFTHLGNQLGFTTRIVRSKDAKAQRRFGAKIVKGKPKSPYLSSKELDEETIESFIKANPDLNPDFIRLSWQFFGTDKLTFENMPITGSGYDQDYFEVSSLDNNVNIIVTSFEQLRIHKKQQVTIPKDWIIWFDDPDVSDVIDIEPYKNELWENLSKAELKKYTTTINNKIYFKRDEKKSLGYSLRDHQCIYTTTELITKKAIEILFNKRNEQHILHDNMENIAGGKITILGTDKVWKRHDGIIPLLSRRLTKTGFPVTLIADGLSAEFNHSNNKGRNDLDKTDILVELSIPHPEYVKTICDALQLGYKAYDKEIRRSLMLDRLHQAIGRNSGYRYKGFQSVVLVDKSIHKSLIQQTRYYIDYDNSVLIDKTGSMSRKDSRITKTATPLVHKVVELLNNIDKYVCDKRIIKPDLDYVVKTVENDSDRLKLIIRILMSFINYSNIRFDDNASIKDDNYIQAKYRDIGNWLLDTKVPRNKRNYVITESHKEPE